MRIASAETKQTLPVPPTASASAPPATPAKTESTVDAPGAGNVPVRRRAKLTDFARVLLPKSEETVPQMDSPETKAVTGAQETAPAAVVPASFPVTGMAGNVIDAKAESLAKDGSAEAADSPVKTETPPAIDAEKKKEPSDGASSPSENRPSSPEPDSSLKDTTRVTLPDSVVTPPPKVRPVSLSSLETVKPPADSREKREFILANGERILGHILSETADTIYLDHPTLGVLTLPRTQIAGKPIEVILINGDRIVGDLIAETTECLYIRHASLGMLTVPHSQRSTRVVEAILKDGDRILGEVLAETDNFTVIRSATLGTVAVQHEQVAMLNRKIEQMQLRALPPALEDAKPDAPSPS